MTYLILFFGLCILYIFGSFIYFFISENGGWDDVLTDNNPVGRLNIVLCVFGVLSFVVWFFCILNNINF